MSMDFLFRWIFLLDGEKELLAALRLEDVVDAAVVPARAPGEKCGRCWRVLDEVGKGEPDDLCDRCAGVVSALDG